MFTGEKDKLPDCRVQKLPVKSALKGVYYPPSMAEGLKIWVDGKEYVVIICHQEANSPTDLEEVDGCLGFGDMIVFDKAVEEKGGDGALLLSGSIPSYLEKARH